MQGLAGVSAAGRAMEPFVPVGLSSFEDWVAARGAGLQRFAFLVSGSAADAPDLVQQALEGVYRRWAEVSAAGTVEAYARRRIVNASISGWRKDRRLIPIRDGGEGVAQEPDLADAVSDADAAWRLCRELPPVQRAAVVLRFYDDLTFARIAEILDCPESTARSHVHRALTALRVRLAESGTGEEGSA